MKRILQVFKNWKHRRKPIYICDPTKATSCSKDACWYVYKDLPGPCKCTSKKKYAKIGKDGKPTIASDMDIWNEEFVEFCLLEGSQKKQGL